MDTEVLKKLIEELECNITLYTFNRNMYIEGSPNYAYFDGKLSEAKLMVDKLIDILANRSFEKVII